MDAKETERTNEHETVAKQNYGYHLYPERLGENYEPSFWRKAFLGEGRVAIDRSRCERTVHEVIEKSPLVKLMISAIEGSGCELNYGRHISCEICSTNVHGGYDPIMNQVIICQNTCKGRGLITSVLTHEFIHMFDYCRANMNFKNLDHLACTEVRASNITDCSFVNAWMYGLASPINVAKRHAECVKTRATESVISARNVSREEARAAVDKVFDRCYNDLSPIGRRLRRNSPDVDRAYSERHMYGYYQ
ncbi:XRCC6BP1 (predicted) [Pycnogonum litorale]